MKDNKKRGEMYRFLFIENHKMYIKEGDYVLLEHKYVSGYIDDNFKDDIEYEEKVLNVFRKINDIEGESNGEILLPLLGKVINVNYDLSVADISITGGAMIIKGVSSDDLKPVTVHKTNFRTCIYG